MNKGRSEGSNEAIDHSDDMTDLDKKSLSERDICTKFITPAVRNAGWDELSQIREQVHFTKGRIIVRGKLVTRGKAKFGTIVIAGELSSLCDRLETQLTTTHTESRRLLEATPHHALTA